MNAAIKHETLKIVDCENILNENILIPPSELEIKFRFSNFLEKAKMKEPMKKMFGTYWQKGELAILAGKAGTGKSILAYTIADGLTRGANILNRENETPPQKVIYYDFELNEGNIQLRLPNYVPNNNFLRPDMTELMLETNSGVLTFDIIENHIIETKADAVIIDNIDGMALKCTQDPETALKIMKGAVNLRNKYDISILIITHTPKLKDIKPLEVYDIAGSAKIMNLTDTAIMIGKTKDTDLRYLKQVKSRNGYEFENVMTMRIFEEDFLHFEFERFEPEENHLTAGLVSNEKHSRLIEFAEKYFSTPIGYIDAVHKYASDTGKSEINGKKKISQLINNNLIVKNIDSKWIVNRNEIEEAAF